MLLHKMVPMRGAYRGPTVSGDSGMEDMAQQGVVSMGLRRARVGGSGPAVVPMPDLHRSRGPGVVWALERSPPRLSAPAGCRQARSRSLWWPFSTLAQGSGECRAFQQPSARSPGRARGSQRSGVKTQASSRPKTKSRPSGSHSRSTSQVAAASGAATVRSVPSSMSSRRAAERTSRSREGRLGRRHRSPHATRRASRGPPWRAPRHRRRGRR